MTHRLLDQLDGWKQRHYKGLLVLIDPDKSEPASLRRVLSESERCGVDLLMVGGSLTHGADIQDIVLEIKQLSPIPVLLFPGSLYQIAPAADGILFLSLISGRNPDLLIGRQVEAAPILRKTKLEVIPTAYMLVDSGKPTTAHYMSNTQPIPHDKPDIAAATALAGEMLGLRLAYLDGGSGAQIPVSAEMVRRAAETLRIPLMIGGGIRTAHAALTAWRAGADMLVIGTALEQDPDCRILHDIADARAAYLQQHPVLP